MGAFSMWEFIVQKGIGIAWGVLAMAAQLGGYTNAAIAFALLGISAFFFVAPVWHHAHAWHQNRISRGLRSVDASHLLMAGLGGIIICAAIALGAVIWGQPRKEAAGNQITPTAEAEYVPPAWAQDAQIRQKLFSFIRSNADEIRDSVFRVNQNVFVAYDTVQGQGPRPLHDIFQQLTSLTFQQSARLLDASIDKSTVTPRDAHEAIGYLQSFIVEYARWQRNIIALYQISRLPPNTDITDSMIQLQKADERAFGSLRDLMAIDSSIPRVDENLLASRSGFFAQWSESQGQSTQQITKKPPSAPTPVRYTAYEKEQRLRAIDEIYSAIATQLQPTYKDGQKIIDDIYKTADVNAEKRLPDYLIKVQSAFDNLNSLLKKYNYFTDIVELTRKNTFNDVEATHGAGNLVAELRDLRAKVPNDVQWFLLRDSTMMDARNQLRRFETYIAETLPRLQDKRAEIEKAEVYTAQ
jgi:hypothetical protein